MCCCNSSQLIPCQQPTIIMLRPVNTADDTRFCSLSPFSGLAFFHSLLSALVSIFILLHPNYLSSSLSPSSRWGARVFVPVQTGPGAHPASYTIGTGGLSGRGVALTTHPHLASRLKKEWSYTFTPPLGLRGPF